MSKGSNRRPEREPGSYRRNYDEMVWRDVLYYNCGCSASRKFLEANEGTLGNFRVVCPLHEGLLVDAKSREEALTAKPGTLMDVFMRELDAEETAA